MNVEIFAINLDRSKERWQKLSERADLVGLAISRVPAVDGTQIAQTDREFTDDAAFQCNAGRLMLKGEYGCYRSHIKALAQFLQTKADIAIIIEDDIMLAADLRDRVAASFASAPRAEVIKFFNHRVVGFRRSATTKLGDEIGRAIHGPLGSAACYGVSRRGAELLINQLGIMEYPWDVALERGWKHGAAVFTTRSNLVEIECRDTTIATRDVYRSVKFPKWKRLGTYARRLHEDAQRLLYALRA